VAFADLDGDCLIDLLVPQPASNAVLLRFRPLLLAPPPQPKVLDRLPVGLTLVSATASQGTCAGMKTVTCALGELPAGRRATITITVRAGLAGTVTNTASVWPLAIDSDPEAHEASAQVIVDPPPLEMAITAPSAGDRLIMGRPYEIRWSASASFRSFDVAVSMDGLPFTALQRCRRLDETARTCTWTPNASALQASVMVTGRDEFGNVATIQSSPISVGRPVSP
jgi:hypothetical protein